MTLNKIFKNVFLAVVLGFVLSACAQQVKKVDRANARRCLYRNRHC